MASIRRTLSPYPHDRTYQNGAAATNSPFSFGSPSQKFFTNNGIKYSSPLSVPIRRFLASIFFQKRKGFRRSFYRCLIFFVVGFFLGIFVFGHHVDNDNDDVRRSHDFSFEIKPPHVNNVQLDDDADNHRSIKDDDLAFNTVSLGIVTQQLDYVSRFDEYLPRKQLIVITPTYNRALQAYFLNRLGQVLRLMKPPLLWIVVEMKQASMKTAEILRKTGVMYRHLVCGKNSTNAKDREKEGFMLICQDLLSTAQCCGTQRDGGVLLQIQFAS